MRDLKPILNIIPPDYRKRSFFRFSTPIDIEILRGEYASIPEDNWFSSYWGAVHCSVGTLLLRGGTQGDGSDYSCRYVSDHPILEKLPYIARLLAQDGPFGGAAYAFLFRMEPNGLTMLHQDLSPAWQHLYRIHIPIHTNPEAVLIADGRAVHFEAGYAWSFHNNKDHGVVNGDQERVHLILDAPFNPAMAALIDNADILDGFDTPELLAKISAASSQQKESYPGDRYIRQAIADYQKKGLSEAEVAGLFNQKGIPTKHYTTDGTGSSGWTKSMINGYL